MLIFKIIIVNIFGFNYKDAVKLQKIMQTKAQELLDLSHQVCILKRYFSTNKLLLTFIISF